MEINYIILGHDNPNQLHRLVNRLNTNNVYFYIHIDLKSNIEEFISISKGVEQIIFIRNRVECIWGDLSMIIATLNCIKQLIKDGRKGYTILMSGMDYPLKNNNYINDFFNQNNNFNYISLLSLPNKNWTNNGIDRIENYKLNISNQRGDFLIIPPLTDSRIIKHYATSYNTRTLKILDENLELLMKPRTPLKYIECFYGGSQWWALPHETIQYILWFLRKHPDYTDFFKYSFVPDELFFHTIIGSSPYLLCNTKNSVTYVDWTNHGPFYPNVFDISYFNILISREELFARKFDLNIDDEILNKIDEVITC